MAAPAQKVEMVAIFKSINRHLAHNCLWALSMAIVAAFVYRLPKTIQRRSRLIASLYGETHRYSSSWGLGHAPSRYQALFLSLILVTNAILCFWSVPYGKPEVLEVLRARTGNMSIANLVPLFIMASPNNPLLSLLDI